MTKFPRDVPKLKVDKGPGSSGIRDDPRKKSLLHERINPDGSKTPLTMPNHEEIEGSTLLIILRQAGITREEFIEVFNDV